MGPSSTIRGSRDPLLAAFIADHHAGLSFSDIARKNGTYRDRVRRALNTQPSINPRRNRLRPDVAEAMGRLSAWAMATLEQIRAQRAAPTLQFAVGTSASLHALRARVRVAGPILADDTRIAAAHAAGLTLDDIHEVFAVPPAEAARAIALHAGR